MDAAREARPQSAEERLLRDRVSTLYSTGWLMTGGNIAAALIILVMLRQVAPLWLMIGWPAVLAVLGVIRAYLFRRYRAIAQQPHSPHFWGAAYTACSIALGCSWGAVIADLALMAPPWELALMIGLASVTVIAGAVNAAYPWAYQGYNTAITLPVAAALVLRGDEPGWELALFILVMYVLGLLVGGRLGAVMTQSLKLSIANADLVVYLTDAFERAEAASEAKSHFLASMSHELRTPLNAVIGYAELLLEDAEREGRAEQVADLGRIQTAGRHLLSMVNDVLDLSKVEAGRMELMAERFDPGALIDGVVSTCQPLAERNGNAIEVTGETLGPLVADATKLRQVLLNLVGNAAKFTERGRITVSAALERGAAGDWLILSVRDTGIGISAENQAKLFGVFSQADTAIGQKYGGTGLGLALSRKLCRLMGGEIAVESALGRGSCFTLRVPVGLAAPAGIAAGAPA